MQVRSAGFADLDCATLYALLRLRCEVFVVEQRCAYPELDGRDTEPATVHLWLDDDGMPVAYLRLLQEADGSARIGRVCTSAAFRGAGQARRLMKHAFAKMGPGRTCVLDAQSYLVPFYSRFGFMRAGEQYLDGGIPHVPMIRTPRVL